ncbi:MAG TPA: tetratricopeptide repeat protein [Terracidiphilus sp.]|nr:tetratricopeptide repeat protein [Terracidiphilus sp.]
MRCTYPQTSLVQQLLPALALLTALICAPLSICAQETAMDTPPAAPPQPAPLAPAFQPTHEDMGDSLLFHRRYQEAIDQYKQAPPGSPDLWNKMGIAYQMLSDLNDAARCYQQSLRLRPDHPLTLNNLGTVFDLLGFYGKAEAFYRRALELNPKSARIAMNLGTNLMIQARYSQGSAMYQRALALDPAAFDQAAGPNATSGVPLQQRGAMNYYKARNCAQAGMNDRAIAYLKMSLDEGFTTPSKIAKDSTFSALRSNPAFQQLLAEQDSN